MPKLRAHNISMSLDGYAAGPEQDREHPLGIGGEQLHEWAFETRTYRRMFGMDGGGEGLDDQCAAQGDENIGATIIGRNMFGPMRGAWPDEEWNGWWGDEPPYHHDVFVLTHHPRASIPMLGGTTFHFVTDGIEAALRRAFEAAQGKDMRVGGGMSTIQQYLRAGLIDEMHFVAVPVLLGRGERLFDHLDGAVDGYECREFVASEAALHARLVGVRRSRRRDVRVTAAPLL